MKTLLHCFSFVIFLLFSSNTEALAHALLIMLIVIYYEWHLLLEATVPRGPSNSPHEESDNYLEGQMERQGY